MVKWAALLAIFLVACTQQTIIESPDPAVGERVEYVTRPDVLVVYDEPDAGRAIFAITDAPVRMDSINELWITIEEIEVHSSQHGWITVSDNRDRYDLLQLREDNEEGILADVVLAPGEYQQVRLTVTDVEVIDDDGEHDAVLPSSMLRFTAPFSVSENGLTYVLFDFDLSRSLHLTGDGRYVLTPVIRVLVSPEARIQVNERERVVLVGGTATEVVVIGTDVRGETGPDRIIPVEVNIVVDNNDRIVVEDRTNGSGNATVNTTTNVTVNAS